MDKHFSKPSVYSISSSSECINECVEVGRHFCLNQNRQFGSCCMSKDGCNGQLCSYLAPNNSISLPWFTCPHTPNYCGIEDQLVAKDWAQRITPTGYYADYLKNGASCRYEITFPEVGIHF